MPAQRTTLPRLPDFKVMDAGHIEVQLKHGACLLDGFQREVFLSAPTPWRTARGRKDQGYYVVRWASTKAQNPQTSRTLVYLHRELYAQLVTLGLRPALQSGETVDHRNRNTLDNRTENLRAASRGAQQHNRRRMSNNSTSYIGIARHKTAWRGSFMVDGVRHRSSRTFPSMEQAARWRDAGVCDAHGDFAVFNFPNEHGQGVCDHG